MAGIEDPEPNLESTETLEERLRRIITGNTGKLGFPRDPLRESLSFKTLSDSIARDITGKTGIPDYILRALGEGPEFNLGSTEAIKEQLRRSVIDKSRMAKEIDNQLGSAVSSMDQAGERELTDTKIDAAEARIDARFVQFNATLTSVLDEIRASRTESKARSTAIITTVIGSSLGILAILIGVLSLSAA